MANVNGFEGGDGNQACASALDWACAPVAVTRTDDPVGAADTVYAGGAKEDDPSGWTTTGGGTQSKSDIQSLWTGFEETADARGFLYLAFSRAGGDGNSFFSFELNQSRGSWTNGHGASVHCRTDGDVLVRYDFKNTVVLSLYHWNGSGGPAGCPDGATGTWTAGTGALASPEGAVNGAPISNLLSSGTLDTGRFGEAALDLTAIATELALPRSCEFFRGLNAHSRSSDSGSAQLQDLVATAPLSVSLCKPDPDPDPDPTDPAVPTVTAPAACDAGSGVTLSGTADPGVQVLIREAGETVAIAEADATTGAWTAVVLGAADGAHAYVARAVDGDGNQSEDSAAANAFADVTPDAPTTITSPADGSSGTGTTVTVSGTAEPGATVSVRRNGSVVGSVVAAADGTWNLGVGVTEGVHELTAQATDGCNAAAGIARVGITVTRAAGDDDGGDGAGGTGGGTGGGGAIPGGPAIPAAEVAVAGEQAVGGLPKGCGGKVFRTFVTDTKRKYRRVEFRVDGKRVALVTRRDGARRFITSIDPSHFKAGAHRLTAVITTVAGAKTTVVRRFRRCDTCQSRRKFQIRVRKPGGKAIRKATVYVNGKKARVLRGTRLRAGVRLTGLPKGRFTVTIKTVTVDGRSSTEKRYYRTCVPKPKKKTKTSRGA